MTMNFDDFLTELDDGETAKHLTAEVQRVVQGVRRTAMAGSLTLTLTFKADGRTVMVVPKVVTKIPTAKCNGTVTVFYDTEQGDLSRTDPKQLKLKNVFQKETSPS